MIWACQLVEVCFFHRYYLLLVTEASAVINTQLISLLIYIAPLS